MYGEFLAPFGNHADPPVLGPRGLGYVPGDAV
jgi:hypothetical protein